jgi:hypothetical protein
VGKVVTFLSREYENPGFIMARIFFHLLPIALTKLTFDALSCLSVALNFKNEFFFKE